MKEGWKYWEGKKVFILTKNNRQYSGKVIEIDDHSAKPLVWVVIIDKFGDRVQFVHSEIIEIKEEKE